MQLPAMVAITSAAIATTAVLFTSLPFSAASDIRGPLLPRTINQTVQDACNEIQANVTSQSGVYNSLSLQYSEYTEHFMSSSQQLPICVFEPTNPADLATAVSRRRRYGVS